MMSFGPMLTMLQPMALAELRARVWFSWMVKVFSLPLLMALSSTVFVTEQLISLLECVCVCVCISDTVRLILWIGTTYNLSKNLKLRGANSIPDPNPSPNPNLNPKPKSNHNKCSVIYKQRKLHPTTQPNGNWIS